MNSPGLAQVGRKKGVPLGAGLTVIPRGGWSHWTLYASPLLGCLIWKRTELCLIRLVGLAHTGIPIERKTAGVKGKGSCQ